MKKNYFKFLLALSLIVPSLAFSQCTNVTAFGSAVAPSVVNATATIICNYAEEYGTWSGCVSGNAYCVTSTVATDFITVRSGSSGGPVVAKGVQPLSFSPSTSGTLYIHINTNSSCGTQQSCRDITMQLLAPCLHTLPFGSVVAPTSITPIIITAAAYAGEYTTVTGAVILATYTTSSSVATDYFTITSGTPNGPVVAAGSSPITWTALNGGTYYQHCSTNSGCATDFNNRTISILCQSCFTPPTPPANDLCANATALAIPSTTAGTTVNATVESPAPPTCVTNYVEPGVWYTVIGNGNQISASLCNTNWDSEIFVYTGSCGSWTCVTGNDDSGPICSGLSASVQWLSTLNTTYYILVSDNSSASAFTLDIATTVAPTPPANDLCVNATPLAIPSTTAGTTVNATVESPAPPTCVTNYVEPGVWYTVIGNGNQISASLCNTVWDSEILIYTGSCGSWTCVTGNDDSGPICSGLSSSVQWLSTLNTTYYILVSGYSSASAFTLDISSSGVSVPSIESNTFLINVFPNPNNGTFTLGVNANVGDLTISITDMQGRVVYASVDKNVSAGFVKQISLDTQSSGMYLMHIIANGEQQTKKISVQK